MRFVVREIEIDSKEGAIHLLRNLVDNLDEDISSDEMTRHLKDALNDAKQFLGIEVNDEEHTDDDGYPAE